MGRSPTPSAVLEPTAGEPAELTVDDFLAHRRALPHLADVAAHLYPAAFTATDPAEVDTDAAAGLCDAIRTKGGPQADVRLLVDDGERYLALAELIARTLRCDVYLTPAGAHVRYIREVGLLTGDLWDAVATDPATGDPVGWQIVRPVEIPAGVPTWFTTVRGKLRRNNGLVAVELPDGITFATRHTFRDAIGLAAHLRPGSSRVTTVAVHADLGRFEISRFDNAGSLLTGVELATLVGASLDLIHPDVQLALTWPTDPAAGASLHTELVRFADGLNRTVWVPRPQGAAFILSGCGEFAAVDEVGGPSEWLAYPARLAVESADLEDPPAWEPRFRTDPDGRLVALHDPVITSFPGVPFVSVPASQLERMRGWYASVRPAADLFPLDLAVLPGGRLGVTLDDGTLLAVAPRALRGWLRDAGWTNEDLVLLAQTSVDGWAETVRHVRGLSDKLAVDIWLPAPQAEVWARAEGGLSADAAEDAGDPWRAVLYRRAVGVDATTLEGTLRPAGLTIGPPHGDSEVHQLPIMAAAVDPVPVPVGPAEAALVDALPVDAASVVLPDAAATPEVVSGAAQERLLSADDRELSENSDVEPTDQAGPDTSPESSPFPEPSTVASSEAAPDESASYEPASYESDSYESASYQSASYESASYESASYEAAPYASASYRPVASETASFESASYEPAAYESASYDRTPYEPVSYLSPSYEPMSDEDGAAEASTSGVTDYVDGTDEATSFESGLAHVDAQPAEEGAEPAGITVVRALGAAGPHGVPWLPDTPVVNRRPLDLYLWTPMRSDELESFGLPSADLFLLAGQDPLRLAEQRRDGYLMRIQAPEATAIDLFEHSGQAPAALRERLAESGCTHLLPLPWLADLRVTARYDLDGYGGIGSRDNLGVGPLQIRFEGAEHGVPGLPNEVVHWPDKGQRTGVPSYLLLPDELRLDQPVAHGGFVALSRRKPELVDGHCLLEVKIRKRKAIDVPATLDNLGDLAVVRRIHDLVGLDLLLPTDELAQASVPRLWRPGPTGRPVVDKLTGETLSDLLEVPEPAMS